MSVERTRRRLHDAGRRGLRAEGLEASTVATLETLQSRGEAICWRQRWFAPGATRHVVGKITGLGRDDVVATSWWRGSPRSWRIPRRAARDAKRGDLVLLDPERSSRRPRSGRRDRRSAKARRARVVKILASAPARLVARVSPFRGRRTWRTFSARDADLVRGLQVPTRLGRRDGEYFLLRLPERGDEPEILEELGDPWVDPGADVRIVLCHHGIPDAFTGEALAEAESVTSDPARGSEPGRRDLTASLAVTIDGSTARDFDDAIGVQRAENGSYEVAVHIADVSAFVDRGSILDSEAETRGTSVYFPGRAVPMLPPGLSEGACSLLPGVDRLVVTASLTFSPTGELESSTFFTSVIRSAARLTYDEVAAFLEDPEGDSVELETEVGDMLLQADALLDVLLEQRAQRGGLELELPELGVQLGRSGQPVEVARETRNRAHRLIEELMIAANSAVAGRLRETVEADDGRPPLVLFRTHPEPSPSDFEELETALASLRDGDVETPVERDAPVKSSPAAGDGDSDRNDPRQLSRLLLDARDDDDAALISMLVLRTLGRARYEPRPKGHYALALRDYCHFTSPIRRYPDLVVHRLLKATIQGSEPPRAAVREQARLGDDLSALERRAERAERELLQWQKVRLLRGREGDRFRGRITGLTRRGLFVHLVEHGADGLVPLDDPRLAPAELDDDGLAVWTARGTLRLGQVLEVRLLRIDEDRRSLDLEL